MKTVWIRVTLALALVLCVAPLRADDDPYLWLEDVHGQKALDWVKARNEEAIRSLPRRRGMPSWKPTCSRSTTPPTASRMG